MGGARFVLFRLNQLFAQMVARAFTNLGKVMLVVTGPLAAGWPVALRRSYAALYHWQPGWLGSHPGPTKGLGVPALLDVSVLLRAASLWPVEHSLVVTPQHRGLACSTPVFNEEQPRWPS